MDASKPIIFYDIAGAQSNQSWSPNTWKTRYALNFKGLHYRTEWVEFPDVASVCKKIGAAPTQIMEDGSPHYTFPVLQDPSTGEVISDSFEIALYLEKTYPNAPLLFPGSSKALQAAYDTQIAATFGTSGPFVDLVVSGIPFSAATAETSKKIVSGRFGKAWEEIAPQGEERARRLEAYKTELGKVAKLYALEEGPFLLGETPSYADLVIGGFLVGTKMAVQEWEDILTWHNGLWGKLLVLLDKYAETM